MGENSAIQWTDHTFNPWRGCSKVNSGCTNCYAEVNISVKLHGVKWGPNGTRVRASGATWREPLKWNRKAGVSECCNYAIDPKTRCCTKCFNHAPRPRVFCASLADVFEDWSGEIRNHKGYRLWTPRNDAQGFYTEESPSGDFSRMRLATMNDLRIDLFDLIDRTPNLDWLLLTKRPENIRRMWVHFERILNDGLGKILDGRHRSNVWLGCSISDQQTADESIPHLLKCRDLAPVLFVSYEPALAKVDFMPYLFPMCGPEDGLGCPPIVREATIDFLIAGGESGSHARPCHIEWIRSAVQQCKDAEVACFVKQLGSKPKCMSTCVIGDSRPMMWVTHPKGGDPAEWPEDLRVREFPNQAIAADQQEAGSSQKG